MSATQPSFAGPGSNPDDSIEVLGFSGTTLMQLWGIEISTISDLSAHNSASLKEALAKSLGPSAEAKTRIENVLAEVYEVAKEHNILIKKEANKVSKTRSKKRALTKAEKAHLTIPSSVEDPVPLLTYYMHRYQLLTRDEQLELIRRVQEEEDQEARDLLVLHNIRLVCKVAARYKWSKLEFADLVQEGIIGLMIGIERFDLQEGTALSTYAYSWIRQAIGRAIHDTSYSVRIPVHRQEKLLKLKEVVEILAEQKGRPPTVTEIANALDVTSEEVKVLIQSANTLSANLNQTSLNDVLPGRIISQDEEEAEFGSLFADASIMSADAFLIAKEELDAACSRVNTLIETLYESEKVSERDCEIFVRIYGLDGSFKRKTLEVVGERIGITREGVRQVVVKVWEKLQRAGVDMDHDSLFEEYERIAVLEKLARKAVTVD